MKTNIAAEGTPAEYKGSYSINGLTAVNDADKSKAAAERLFRGRSCKRQVCACATITEFKDFT